jgi:hypothetical protein
VFLYLFILKDTGLFESIIIYQKQFMKFSVIASIVGSASAQTAATTVTTTTHTN